MIRKCFEQSFAIGIEKIEVTSGILNRDASRGDDDLSQLRLLAISFAYPPLAYPRSIHVARLLKHVEASTVVVCAEEAKARTDSTIDNGAEIRLEKCIRVPFEISSRQRLLNRLFYRICRPLWAQQNEAPDRYKAWGPAAVREVVNLIRSNSYEPDVLITFGQPFTGHLVGLELKRRYGFPWLAHFSDPWVDNPFNHYEAYTRKLNLRLERRVVESADVLAFTSPETIDLVMRKYPSDWVDKSCVVPQSFDEKLFPATRPPENSSLIVRHVGDFYGPRTPAPLINALRRLLDDCGNSLADVRFELIGNCDAEMRDQVGVGLPDGLLTFRTPVAYGESLRLMSDADGLLLVDAPADLSIFLPSKLIDYAGSGRPLLGFTPPGTAATLIKQLGGAVADPLQIEEMSKSLAQFIDVLRHRRSASHSVPWGDQRIRKQFEAQSVAREFKGILEKMRRVKQVIT